MTGQWIAIVNPHSGGNGSHDRLTEILHGLRSHTGNIVMTRYPGHATELAAKADGGVASVGGDGTLFEILKGIDLARQRVAVIPAGRGNSLARDLGLVNGSGLFTALHWEQTNAIDLMEVIVTASNGADSTHLAASTVAFGYPAAVVVMGRRMARLGRMSYAAAATAVLPPRFVATVQYGDGPAREVRLSGFIANNTRHMANFAVFRKADCRDGVFDVMEMDAGVVKQTIHNLSALSGTGLYEPYASMQAKTAKLRLQRPQTLMLDGELLPDVVAIEVRILPSALSCNGPRTLA